MWSVREVVLPCQRQDQMLGRPIRVTCRERYQAGEDPEERNPLDHDGTCLRHRQSRNSEVRSPYLNSRRSMKKDPDKICCASEADNASEAHEKVKEPLNLQQDSHRFLPITGQCIWSC